jgi:hypothetical protein
MRCLTTLVFGLLTSLLTAQATPPNPDLHPAKQRVIDEVTRKRDDMRDGRSDRFNVRVRVRLKNGAKLNGVVKNGRLIEREAGIDFVETDRLSPDAGIRLYYFDETTSFVFLRWADIATHKVLVKLTDEEVRAIEREFAERERKREELRKQLAASRASAATTPPDGEGKNEAKPHKPGSNPGGEAEPAATPLLTEFPPSEGWGEAKVKEIEQRKVVVGVYPNAKEKRFLAVFEEWKKQAATQAETEGGTPAPGKQ